MRSTFSPSEEARLINGGSVEPCSRRYRSAQSVIDHESTDSPTSGTGALAGMEALSPEVDEFDPRPFERLSDVVRQEQLRWSAYAGNRDDDSVVSQCRKRLLDNPLRLR